jgi:hypothetical protein
MKTMRKFNLSQVLGALASLFFMVCMVAVGLDIEIVAELFGLAGGASSISLAVTSVGTIAEETYPTDLFERDVDDIVVMYKPDRFPITTVANAMQSAKPCAQRKFEWVEVGYFPRQDATTGNITGGANAVETFAVADVAMWGIGDIVYIPTITHGAPATEFRGLVVDRNIAGNTIDVKAITGDALVPAVPSATAIYRQSRGATATQAQADAQGSEGTTLWNYNQTFILQIEMEKLLKRMQRYMNDESVQHDLALFDYRNSCEHAWLFGPRSKTYDPNKDDYVYTVGGIEHFAGQADTYTTGSINNAKWINLTKKMFAGNAGSQTRLVVGGADFIEEVLNTPSVEKQLASKETKVKLGIEISEVTTNYGKVWLKHHKGFDEMGRAGDAFSLDMAHIRERILEPMEETELELDKTGQKRVDATRMIKTSTLQVRYPDTHMAIKKV